MSGTRLRRAYLDTAHLPQAACLALLACGLIGVAFCRMHKLLFLPWYNLPMPLFLLVHWAQAVWMPSASLGPAFSII